MNFHYYKKLGFSPDKLRARLEILDLTENDHPLVELLHKLVSPHTESIIDAFYQKLFQDEDAKAVIDKGFKPEKLRITFNHYIGELGVAFDTPEYFESRLRVGMVHIWAGVSLSLYQTAYRILQDQLVKSIPRDEPRREDLIFLILKLTNLDMSLAIQAYHLAQTSALEEQLVSVRERVSFLQEKQQIDSLTQIFSRETVLSALSLLLERSANEGLCFCVIMADIDHFKEINDIHGHMVGDKVLHGVAKRLKGSFRIHDFVGRFGGEEFLLVLNNTQLDTAIAIAERVLSEISESPFHSDGENIDVTISLGLTQVKAGDTRDSIVNRADKALYQAKRNGRNRLEVIL